MKNVVCKNSRTRGISRLYGANRTGRFSVRIVQLQNLPQNHMSDLAVHEVLQNAEIMTHSVFFMIIFLTHFHSLSALLLFHSSAHNR